MVQNSNTWVAEISQAVYDVESFTCWLLIFLTTLSFDVNYFFVKAILWLEPSHWLVFIRGLTLALAAAHACRQAYEYMNNPSRQSIGVQLWILLATLMVEVMFILKNAKELSQFL